MVSARRVLRTLSPSEAVAVSLLVLASIVLWPLLRMIPLERLAAGIRRVGRRFSPWSSRVALDRRYDLADLATRIPHGRSRCLPRTLLLAGLTDSGPSGLDIVVGVDPGQNTLQGHAWAERDGCVVGESLGDIRRFAELLRL